MSECKQPDRWLEMHKRCESSCCNLESYIEKKFKHRMSNKYFTLRLFSSLADIVWMCDHDRTFMLSLHHAESLILRILGKSYPDESLTTSYGCTLIETIIHTCALGEIDLEIREMAAEDGWLLSVSTEIKYE